MANDCNIPFGEYVKSFGPLITAFVAVYLYYRASQRDKKKEMERKKLERELRLQYIYELTSSSIKLLNHRWKLANNYLDEFKASLLAPKTFVLSPIVALERLFKVIGDEVSFRAVTQQDGFESADNALKFYTMFTVSIDYLNGLSDNIEETVRQRFEAYLAEGIKYTDSLNKLADDINYILIELQLKDMTDTEKQFFEGVIGIQNALLPVTSSIGFEYQNNHFVTPFLNLANTHYNSEFKDVIKLSNLINQARGLSALYEQMLANTRHHIFNMEHSRDNLKKALDGLRTQKEELQAIIKGTFHSHS